MAFAENERGAREGKKRGRKGMERALFRIGPSACLVSSRPVSIEQDWEILEWNENPIQFILAKVSTVIFPCSTTEGYSSPALPIYDENNSTSTAMVQERYRIPYHRYQIHASAKPCLLPLLPSTLKDPLQHHLTGSENSSTPLLERNCFPDSLIRPQYVS
jgi:hypothetical protein